MNSNVSVHIVTYNSADDIARCLQAVEAQTYPISQIIVVDNASSDCTVEQVESQSHLITDQLLLVRNQANVGFAPAHNQAITLSSTDYILVLNPDVTLNPDYIKLLIEVMQERADIGSATGKLLLSSNPDVVDSTGLIMNNNCRAFDRGAGDLASQWNESGEVFGASGAAALYSRTMVEDISVHDEFFDSDFFAYKEDVDVAWRAQLLGWKSYYLAEAIGYHARGWKQGGRNAQPLFLRRVSYINRYKMMYKNLDSSSIFKSFIRILPYEIASNGYFLIREPKLLGAWGAFWRQLPLLRAKRKEIANKRKRK
ncbi:glycosyltransferase family 2 protein [Paenibacillus macquariensis]|uniref:Glycosyltransferase, GT2 family n=1 Tax=Paenibacillus macquariensis TaxID=948756 RepID=A0ABY1K6E9_9BACL|nr:glycosyltransferase family 2 protein [Paenibacillus macquariensis]MEC0093588.1 glycosyltransferase family 2 protein [Paenibacillus macquariensis]OAB35591.1 glycosyl transferase [Paenibacillus macquariensis subsp. macquariensis]SIR32978.1 Glycosyltransferase, GT2 family [Paenibacillus macquariensis]